MRSSECIKSVLPLVTQVKETIPTVLESKAVSAACARFPFTSYYFRAGQADRTEKTPDPIVEEEKLDAAAWS